MQKTTSAFIIGISLLMVLGACQPKSEKATTAPLKADELQQTSPPIKVAEPKAIQNNTIDAKTCLALNKSMQKVDGDSKIEAIYSIQEQLKACLATANNADVLALLKNYQAMYSRFLGTDLYMDDEDFYEIAEALEQGKKPPVAALQAMSPRIQYLVKLVASKADVSILYVGEGIYVFDHDLKAMADIFSPYLPKDQQAFIQRMAQDNQDIFWDDAAIAVSFDEVIERAVFWESYVKTYPNSPFIKDAKILFALYRHALFFGSDNTQWTDDAVHEFVEPEYKQALQKLAKLDDSSLAKDAGTLLSFTEMSDSEREQAYPVPAVDEESYEIQHSARGRYQSRKALPIPSPWQDDDNRDCMSGIICVDYNID